ncbi:g6495 [Coccomyxa elongata]
MNEYEKAREARIKRNKARLAELQVGALVDGIVAKKEAAERELAAEDERKKAQIRAELEAVEPRRKSARASAAQTRMKLATQAQSRSPAGESEEANRRGSASDSRNETAASDGDDDGGEEEVDYDPLADLAHSGSDRESEEDEDEQASEDSGLEADTSDAQAARKRGRHTGSGKSVCSRKDKQPAGQLPPEPSSSDGEDENGDDDDDADLQRALALSFMESNIGHTEPSTAGRTSDPSHSVEEAHHQCGSKPAKSSDSPANPSGSNTHKAEGRNEAVGQPQQLGKGRKRRKGFPLKASPQNIKKAFAMIAPRKKRITREDLAAVWESVRGGSLDSASANNMMTYAADVTGSEQLDFEAFQKLVAHFS